MPKVVITRTSCDGIPLDEWLKAISESPGLLPVPPREGINPFTRTPAMFHAAPGNVYFDGPGGKCTIHYQNGQLLADVPDPEALVRLEGIAARLNATITELPGRNASGLV
jgi:hypothetical protein